MLPLAFDFRPFMACNKALKGRKFMAMRPVLVAMLTELYNDFKVYFKLIDYQIFILKIRELTAWLLSLLSSRDRVRGRTSASRQQSRRDRLSSHPHIILLLSFSTTALSATTIATGTAL
jgi:hypothetical protein